MSCEGFRENVEAYALGALEPVEARQLEVHLATCSECTDLVNAYRMAVDHLALAVPMYRAPRRLRDRVLDGAGAGTRLRILRSRWVAAAAATILLGFAVGGLAWGIILSAQVDRLREDNASLAELTQLDSEQRSALLRLQGDLNSAKSEQNRMSQTLSEQATLIVLALDPDLIPTELQGTTLAPAAYCNYVWSTTQSVGALTCKNLPSTAFALTYELWATKGDKTVPMGTFTPRFDGTGQLLVKPLADAPGPITNLWVTLEATASIAGQTKPSNEVVLQTTPGQQAAR